MNRLGWGILLMIVLLVGGFFALQHPGGRDFTGRAETPEPSRASRAPVLNGLIVPVQGIRPDQLADSWHDPRDGGARTHEALDIPAPGGTPVLAAMAGTVDKLFQSVRGGITVYVRSNDSQWIAYYAHLSAYAPGLHEGQHVGQGEVIAFVGDTGDAGPGNTHLHFALQRMAAGERWWQGTPVNPFPTLAGQPRR